MSNIQATIYDTSLNPVADLKNAHNLSYSKVLNRVWKAQFSLPTTDPHFDEVQGRRFVELFEDGDRVDLFRIERPRESHDDTTFKCKHVLSTLLDDFLVNTHSGIVGTNSAIDYVLGEQDVTHWQKGMVDFSRNFHHSWTDRTLLYALFEIPNRYNTDYQWTWDTSSYPWTINLTDPSTDTQGLIYYENNADDITKDEDYSDLVTKLFAYGNGSGAVQISLSDSSSTSNDYILDSTAQGKYGTITRVWEDQRYTDPDSLYAAAQARLDRKSTPRTVYSVEAIDIFRKTGWNELGVGQYYTVRDKERGIDVNLRIEKLSKGDLTGKPSDINIELANKQKAFPDHGRVSYADDLDQVKDGAQYAKVYSTQIEAGEILLSAIKGGAAPTMPVTPDTAGLYLGADHLGYHDGSNWITYMDLDGKFRLEGTSGYLHWDPATETLDIQGSIALTNTIAATDVDETSGRKWAAESGADVTANNKAADADFVKPVSSIGTPGSSGLYLGSDVLGYYDGGTWTAYIDNQGHFKFEGDSSNYITWDGSTFTIRGSLTASDITTGMLDFNNISKSGLEVIESEIANNAVTKDKISVVDLSAIEADMGHITAGYQTFEDGSSNVIMELGENALGSDLHGIRILDSSGDTKIKMGETSSGEYGIETMKTTKGDSVVKNGDLTVEAFTVLKTFNDSNSTTDFSCSFSSIPTHDQYRLYISFDDVDNDQGYLILKLNGQGGGQYELQDITGSDSHNMSGFGMKIYGAESRLWQYRYDIFNLEDGDGTRRQFGVSWVGGNLGQLAGGQGYTDFTGPLNSLTLEAKITLGGASSDGTGRVVLVGRDLPSI